MVASLVLIAVADIWHGESVTIDIPWLSVDDLRMPIRAVSIEHTYIIAQ